jgi:hypothetical protein
VQFRLQTLCLLFVVLWTSLAVFGAIWGLVAFALAIAAGLILNKTGSLFGALLLIGSLVLVVLLLLPAQARSSRVACRHQCENNLHRIALAMLRYDASHGSLPPAYVTDKNGNPMHSWRVLLLPFFEDDSLKSLYDRYDFSEPWNGPHNWKLLSARPPVYVCPANEGILTPGNTLTSYVVPVGSHTAWRKGKPRSLNDPGLSKHAATTILVTETADKIEWTEPKDVSLDALIPPDLSRDSVTVSSKHGCYGRDFFHDYEYGSQPYVVCVAAADGHNSCIPSPAFYSAKLPTILTIGTFDEDAFDKMAGLPPPDSRQYKETLRWRNCCALAVWLASVGLLLYRARRSRKTA